VSSTSTPGFKLNGRESAPSTADPLTSVALAGRLGPRHMLPVHPRSVQDQGIEVPCCVSCALTSAMETLDAGWPELSPLFQYFTARSAAQNSQNPALSELTLTQGRDGLRLHGICESSLHVGQFTPAGAAARPSEVARTNAKRHRLRTDLVANLPVPRARSLTPSEINIKSELLANRPVVLGFVLPAGFKELLALNGFKWTDESVPQTSPPTGHAVLVCGFDEALRAFCVQDSRGGEFGLCGKWWMGYRIVNSRFAQRAMTIWK
jgi:hypothetical protein